MSWPGDRRARWRHNAHGIMQKGHFSCLTIYLGQLDKKSNKIERNRTQSKNVCGDEEIESGNGWISIHGVCVLHFVVGLSSAQRPDHVQFRISCRQQVTQPCNPIKASAVSAEQSACFSIRFQYSLQINFNNSTPINYYLLYFLLPF